MLDEFDFTSYDDDFDDYDDDAEDRDDGYCGRIESDDEVILYAKACESADYEFTKKELKKGVFRTKKPIKINCADITQSVTIYATSISKLYELAYDEEDYDDGSDENSIFLVMLNLASRKYHELYFTSSLELSAETFQLAVDAIINT